MLDCVEQLAPLSLCNSDYNNLNLTVTLQYGIHIKTKPSDMHGLTASQLSELQGAVQ